MTRYELREYLHDYLKSNGYIQDPIVTVDFYNAKFSVLGEVTRPGQFAMTTDRVSVFDAVAMAGDLTIFGERDKVHVIRDEKGKQTVVTLDLTKPEVVSSPYFYLRQNDVVYVEPNKAKSSNREMSTLYTFGVSFINLAVGIATLVINIHNMK
jgi:polysaccharide export outer membrane protein